MKKILFTMLLSLFVFTACQEAKGAKDKSANGISAEEAKSNLKVKKQSNGMTLEQSNIVRSYEVENKPGAVKHLYVISPFNGKVLIYSTVAGKVTSNTKSLSPSSVSATDGQNVAKSNRGMLVNIHGYTKRTTEVMNESGTYGTSKPEYIFWWDTRGVYHKHFVTGGQMIHISDQPMPVRDIVLNMNIKAK